MVKRSKMSLQIGPEISVASDIGNTIEITDINDFDLGLLGNKNKLSVGTPPRSSTPTMTLNGGGSSSDGGLKAVDDIEFVNLEDTAVSFDVKPTTGPNTSDTIRILRDGPISVPPHRPIEAHTTMHLNGSAPPQPTSARVPASSGNGWFSKLTGGLGSTSASTTNNGSEGGWFSSTTGTTDTTPVPATYLTPEQESAKKVEALTLLERMDRKGVGGTKMTMANTLDEINAEVARRKDSKNLEGSIRFQRSMLTTITHGMEILNSRYDPLGIQLDGWSEQLNENIEDYDEIFEELYDKYKDKSKVAPEVRLIMSLGLSAGMCHVTNSMFRNKMPGGMDDLLRNNPALARQMAQAAAEQVGPGFAKFVSLGTGGAAQGPSPAQPQMRPPPPSFSVQEPQMPPMMPPMGGGMAAPIASKDPRGGIDIGTARREMRGPTGVDDILAQIEANSRSAAPSRSVPPTAIDADDLGSVGSGMTTETMRRAGLTRRRKTTTVQPVGATLTLNV